MLYVPFKRQLADVLKKGLNSTNFDGIISKLGPQVEGGVRNCNVAVNRIRSIQLRNPSIQGTGGWFPILFRGS